MRWEGGKKSDNLEDRRRLGPVGGAAAGGGIILIIALIMLCMGADPRQIGQLLQKVEVAPPGGAAAGPANDRPETADEIRSREFAATILGFTEEVWGEQFRRAGSQYAPPKMVLFSERVATGCGVAPAAVGPFYCPADRTVYLDPTFFEELERKMGGSKAEFSQAYVIAHEIGHHVQNLLGYSELVDSKRRVLPKAEFNEWSVRLELQADYLAGVWAHHGQEKFRFIEPGDVATAIQSANAIGDDRLQRASSGFVSPESFTHGTSEQRVKWFSQGLKTGDLSMLEEIFKMPYERL
jgi:predicted metalloprotease